MRLAEKEINRASKLISHKDEIVCTVFRSLFYLIDETH